MTGDGKEGTLLKKRRYKKKRGGKTHRGNVLASRTRLAPKGQKKKIPKRGFSKGANLREGVSLGRRGTSNKKRKKIAKKTHYGLEGEEQPCSEASTNEYRKGGIQKERPSNNPQKGKIPPSFWEPIKGENPRREESHVKRDKRTERTYLLVNEPEGVYGEKKILYGGG